MGEHHRVAVVGSGFAGIGASVALQGEGIEHVVLERAADVGGTWRDNRYPGCRCDVPSHLYSFSFAPNPDWSETYSPQPEIQAYLRRVAEERGVVARTRFGAALEQARWDADARRWELQTAAGPLTADVLLLGNGPLAEPATPDIPGIRSFAGTTFHSAAWPAGTDLTGQRVAVIGTGSSAVQFVPEIQPVVEHVTVFQRTPAWVIPHRTRKISRAEHRLYRRVPAVQRAVRAAVYWSRELIALGMVNNRTTAIEKLARTHLAEQVPDAELRAKLTPTYKPGCKRLLLSDSWYPALQQPNVDLVTEKVVEVRPDAVVTADGVRHEVDVLVLGTGFRVLDNPTYEMIRGADGRTMAEHWREVGTQAHLGAAVPGFPNLFQLAGPNTGIGHTSLVVMIEAQLRYVMGALRTMEATGAHALDLRPTALAAWTEEMRRRSQRTVWASGGCASWYLDAEGRNGAIWPGQTFEFVRRTRRFDVEHYELVGAP